MSKVYPNINLTSDTWQTALTRINNLVDTLAVETVTANSSATGALTVGNSWVAGISGGITLVANAIQGGNVATIAALNMASNLTFLPASQLLAGNLVINGLGWFVGGATNAFANTTAVGVGANV